MAFTMEDRGSSRSSTVHYKPRLAYYSPTQVEHDNERSFKEREGAFDRPIMPESRRPELKGGLERYG